jgi:hypothetical protein
MRRWNTRLPVRLCGTGALLILIGSAAPAHAQMVTGESMPGYAGAFGLREAQRSRAVSVQQTAVRAGDSEGANVLWSGERATFTFRFVNRTNQPLEAEGFFELIAYQTSVPVGDVWVPRVTRLKTEGREPLRLRLPPGGSADLSVTPKVPERFGGYALIADLGRHGRTFAAALVRVPKPDPGRVQYPTYALDLPWPFEMSEAVATLFERLGVKGCRMGAGYYPMTFPDFEARHRELRQHLQWAWKHRITVLLTVGEGGAPMPLGRPRPWLADDGRMLDTKSDYAWLPEYDADFERWSQWIAETYGWTRGPVNAMELWNEPWEGISISGWGADMLRYRDLYRRMAQGIVRARQARGVQVLIGGASSSSNTRDKLFPDGSDEFLPWLDFVSIHYQPLSADPALERRWVQRKSPYGPVRVWDTESWVANSEDRVAAVIASMRAQGQSRTAGIYHGNVYTPQVISDQPRMGIAQAWSPAAAVAAAQKFIGQRPFREILFRNGLPWIFVFDGVKGPDDGTVVVVGDLGMIYDRNRSLFRSITGLANAPKIAEARRRLSALPPDAKEEQRQPLLQSLAAAQVTEGAAMTLQNRQGRFFLTDFYGNRLPDAGGRIVVPLNGRGYFLRTDGSPGSFSALLNALRTASIRGYTPVEIVAHDLLAPVSQRPTLRLTLTNILNRPVRGTLQVAMSGLRLQPAALALSLRPHETRRIALRVTGGRASPDNSYRLTARFDAGRDGVSTHQERMRVNLISRRTIRVDGDLSDWRGALPQIVSAAEGLGVSMTERAYLPFVERMEAAPAGTATAWLACDDRAFYFAARIADPTPWEGGVRYETRDDDQYFYPPQVYAVEKDGARTVLTWPKGVRRFSYRKDPDLPSGNGTDSVQIAFNVLPPERKSWLSHPPGTMPRFMVYEDTDYEFALNPVAERWGGGTEIWRLQSPGAPRKHFYPRQPRAPVDGGPVKSGQLVIRREGAVRLVEAAIPWSEIPEAYQRMRRGETIRFSFRVNDNAGPAYELAVGRSVSKDNPRAFHNDWTTHWANEIEFAFERSGRPQAGGRDR